jgi:poly(hydroxyalkanoate) depolymerase family esterase
MVRIDWRELYAQNQAAIAASGIRSPSGVSTAASAVAPALPGGRGRPPASIRRDDGVLVHVPRHLDPSVPVAAVCMLHGCTQDPATFAAATAMNDTADRHGFVVVYPGQPRTRNAQGCWNWFLPAHQQRGAGEPEVIAGIARRLNAREFGQAVDPARVFVAGLSSGGAMALVLAACYPDLFAAVAIHSGLAYRSAEDVASAFAAMRGTRGTAAPDGRVVRAAMGKHARPVPSLVIQGTADRTVAPLNASHILAQSMHANHLAAPESGRLEPHRPSVTERARSDGGLLYTRERWLDAHGALMHESIEIDNLGHAWSGGDPGGSYTDPRGPSASEAIWTFFAQAARTSILAGCPPLG